MGNVSGMHAGAVVEPECGARRASRGAVCARVWRCAASGAWHSWHGVRVCVWHTACCVSVCGVRAVRADLLLLGVCILVCLLSCVDMQDVVQFS